MPLVLTITPLASPGGGRGGDRQIRTLAQGSMSIGRAPGNDWVLADPDQHLSRTHCMVAFEGGRYVMTDLSTNGMLVNGASQPTARNSRVVLTDGDSVRLGGYMLEVAEADAAPGAAAPSPFGARSFVTAAEGGEGAAGGGPLDIDPLEDMGGSAAHGFQHPLAHHPPALRTEDPFDIAENARPRPPGAMGAGLDDDLFRGRDAPDAFKGPAQSQHGDVRGHAYAAPRPIPRATTPAGDIDFDALIGDVSPVAAPHPLDPQTPAAPAPRPPVTDFDDLLGDLPLTPATPIAPPQNRDAQAPAPASAPTSIAPPTPPNPTPTAAQPPIPVTPTPVTAAPVAPAAPAAVRHVAGSAADAALLAAFLDGAGLAKLELGGQDPQAAMRAVGVLFAAFVAGTREVLMSRAEVKSELRVERTMLRARDNNALKFSVSPAEAAAALLQPRAGYKEPLAAVEEAFRDIRSHEMAVMAGLQTALIALLKRFDPAGLEARLQKGGMFDAILPGARRARFWELFCTTYNDIAREAEDDFHSVFGREFARAYAAQVGKL